MKSKTFQIIIFGFILLLIGIIAYLILSRPDTEKPAIIKHETGITKERATIDSLLLHEELLRMQIKEDSAKTQIREAALKREIRGQRKELQELRPVVQKYLDSIPALKEYTDLQDGVIQKQSELIDSLQTWQSIERMKFKRLLLAGDEKFNASVSINGHLRDISEIRKKDNRRLKKINRLLLVAVPVGFVGGVLLAK